MTRRPDDRTPAELRDLPVPEHRAGFWEDVERGWRAGDEAPTKLQPAGRDRVRRLRAAPAFALVATAAVVLLVGAATAWLLRPGSDADVTQEVPTTVAPVPTTEPPTTTSTSTTVLPSALGAAPWAAGPLTGAEVPDVLGEQWNKAENQLWCSALAPDPSFLENESAQPRAAMFGGGWAVAWDRAEGAGRFASGEYCSDCGRSAFGIAGTGVAVFGDAAWRQPNVLEWSGGVAGYGGSGFDDSSPERLAEIVVDGQGCLYQVWSYLGDEHLVSLIESLRLVDGMSAEPVELRGPDSPQIIIDGGAAPWASGSIPASSLPRVFTDQWDEADGSVARVFLADVGEEVAGATIRSANLGVWGVAWDNPDGPGHDSSSFVCTDCGRGVVGLGQEDLDGFEDESVSPPYRVTWDDGSYAEFGAWYGDNALPLDRLRYVDPETGELIEGPLQARLSIVGLDDGVVIWTHLGQDHLLYLLSQLRLVE